MKKIAIITGASQGIGKSIAVELAKLNIKTLLISRNIKKLKKLKKYLIKNGCLDVEILKGNVKDISLPKKAIKICKKNWGSPNILINNTGGPKVGSFSFQNINNWKEAIDNNFLSVINFTTIVAKEMIKINWGRLITISSTIAKEPSKNMVLSASTRAGVLAFNKSISIELAEKKITTNTILLGGFYTSRLKNLIKKNSKANKMSFKKYKRQLEKKIPMGRFGEPGEVSKLVSFLISDNAEYINGQNIIIDGGLSKSL